MRRLVPGSSAEVGYRQICAEMCLEVGECADLCGQVSGSLVMRRFARECSAEVGDRQIFSEMCLEVWECADLC
jgi:hypothetical protein